MYDAIAYFIIGSIVFAYLCVFIGGIGYALLAVGALFKLLLLPFQWAFEVLSKN